MHIGSTVRFMGTRADALARNQALWASRGLPATITDPAILRIVASIMTENQAGRITNGCSYDRRASERSTARPARKVGSTIA
jgi:hypothetical protein